jgi:integrase
MTCATRENPVLKTASAPGLIWDDSLKGFALRVYPSGTKSFLLIYWINGRERRHTIGNFPTWTVEAARLEAKALRRLIDQGRDPAQEKRERREAPTVQDLIERYIEEHLPRKVQGSRARDECRMLAEIGKSLGLNRKVADIHFGDMERLHKAITASGRPVRANRVLAIASKMFSLSLLPRAGEAKPWRDAAMGNPCRGVQRNPEQGRERFFSQAELVALGDALEDYGSTPASDLIRLVILTGCRPAEAAKATWEQFDREPGNWVKPSAHTKQRREHRVPLSPAAIELVERIRKRRGRNHATDWVFPGQKAGERLKDYWDCWGLVRERATVLLWADSKDEHVAKVVAALRKGLKREPTAQECLSAAAHRKIELPAALLQARLYDARHSFASIGAARGMSLLVLGKLLGHTLSRTTEKYAHLGDDPLREAAEQIGAVISRAGRSGANIADPQGLTSVHKPLPQRSQTDPEKLAEALLAEAEKLNRPVVETRLPDGRVMFDVVRPRKATQGWVLWEWEPRKRGRPKKNTKLTEEDQKGLKLERAILNAIKKNSRQRSSRAITSYIITDEQSGYYGVPFDTLFKRVHAAIAERGECFWQFYELHELAAAEPWAELLHELGLQSLKYLEEPFGGRIIRGRIIGGRVIEN